MKTFIFYAILFLTNILFSQSEIGAPALSLEVKVDPPHYPGCFNKNLDLSYTCAFNSLGKDLSNLLSYDKSELPECDFQVMNIIFDVSEFGDLKLKEVEGDIISEYKQKVDENIPLMIKQLENNRMYATPANDGHSGVASTLIIPFVIPSKGFHNLGVFEKNGIQYKFYLKCDEESDHWIRRGTALLTQLDD